jgi:hypothetical protein
MISSGVFFTDSAFEVHRLKSPGFSKKQDTKKARKPPQMHTAMANLQKGLQHFRIIDGNTFKSMSCHLLPDGESTGEYSLG